MYKNIFSEKREDSVSYGTAEDKIMGPFASALGSAFASIFAIAPVIEYANHGKYDIFTKIVDEAYTDVDKKLTHDEGLRILDSYKNLSDADKSAGRGYFSRATLDHASTKIAGGGKAIPLEEFYLNKEMTKSTGTYEFWHQTKSAYANHNMNRNEYNAIWKAHDNIIDPLSRKGALSIYNDIIWRNAYDFDRYEGSFERDLLNKIVTAARNK